MVTMASKMHFPKFYVYILGTCVFLNHTLVFGKPNFQTKCQKHIQHQNFSQALTECHVKALKNDPESQYFLGMMYFQGLGTVANNYAALKWLSKSAESNFSLAQYQLGRLYSVGVEINRDEKTAAKWFVTAANNQVPDAAFSASLIYRLGLGVPREDLVAYGWYQLALKNRFPGLKSLTTDKLLPHKTLTPEAGEKEYQKALELQLGLNGKVDQSEAIRLLQIAADVGHAEALVSIANCYQYGSGLPQNDAEAFRHYKKAALLGHIDAMYHTSYRYQLGLGAPQDTKQAVNWFLKANEVPKSAKNQNHLNIADKKTNANQIIKYDAPIHPLAKKQHEDNGNTLYQKAIILLEENTQANLQEAISFITQSAQLGHKEAQLKLGLFYFQGKGVPQNYVYSYSWLNLASAQGVTEAFNAKNLLQTKMTPDQIKEAERLSQEVFITQSDIK